MTPDELFTRVHRQRADLAAVELAMDALMIALPPDVQQKWLATLQALQSKRTKEMHAHQMDPMAIAQSNDAINRRVLRLKNSGDLLG